MRLICALIKIVISASAVMTTGCSETLEMERGGADEVVEALTMRIEREKAGKHGDRLCFGEVYPGQLEELIQDIKNRGVKVYSKKPILFRSFLVDIDSESVELAVMWVNQKPGLRAIRVREAWPTGDLINTVIPIEDINLDFFHKPIQTFALRVSLDGQTVRERSEKTSIGDPRKGVDVYVSIIDGKGRESKSIRLHCIFPRQE